MSAPSSAVKYANELLKAGAHAEAVRALSEAVHQDDPEATYTLALWHIYGHPVPRNFITARALFARAGMLEHAESARTYAVFVAIGAGGPPDWPAAVALIENAAKNDAVAARQYELLTAMQLRSDGRPQTVATVEVLSVLPRLALVPSLFTFHECAHVIALSEPRMTTSVVVDPTTGKQSPHPIRTSDGAVLGPIQQDLVVHALNLRVAAVTGTQESQGEPAAIMRYLPGQQYRLHHDCLPNEPNQRIITLIAYLNDQYDDGATYFPAIDLSVRAKTGDAILFHNVLVDGSIDEQSRHAGLPVTHGKKWICTRWIRQTPFDPWGMRG